MAGPYTALLTAKVKNIIRALRPAFTNMVDESGRTVTLPLRSIGSAEMGKLPEITVGLRPGAIPFMGGWNVQKFDEESGKYICGVYARNCEIVLTLHTLNEAERQFFADAIFSVVLASYNITGSLTNEFSVQKSLGEVAVEVIGFGQYTEEKIDPGAERPYGQEFTAELPILCNMWLVWAMPPYISQGGTIQTHETTSPTDIGQDGQFIIW